MKAAFALSLAVAYANAQATTTTTNECWKGEGGRYVGECSDVYFFTCDNYIINKESSCNVYTFSDGRLTWNTSDIKVQYWEYYLNDFQTHNNGGEGFEDGKTCYPLTSIPK